jgi:hypothetical protein
VSITLAAFFSLTQPACTISHIGTHINLNSGVVQNGLDSGNTFGAPHVNENVLFNPGPGMQILAQSVEVRLSKFEYRSGGLNKQNKIDPEIGLASGATIRRIPAVGPGNAPGDPFEIFRPTSDDKVWDVVFANIDGIEADDQVEWFSIRAEDDNPDEPSGTADRFLITGFQADVTVVPVPGAFVLGVAGLGLVGWGRKRFLHE